VEQAESDAVERDGVVANLRRFRRGFERSVSRRINTGERDAPMSWVPRGHPLAG